MKRESVRGNLLAAVHRYQDLPRLRRPLVVLVGRSNVGKSSLLNCLLGKRTARVSKTPGKTRGIYIYDTSEEYDLADLPGAGFASVSGQERRVWARLVDELFRSGHVALAVHLIDARVPDAAADQAMRDYLAGLGVPALTVATKWDRLSARERARSCRSLEEAYGPVLPTSARSGHGIEILRRKIFLGLSRPSGEPDGPPSPQKEEGKCDG